MIQNFEKYTAHLTPYEQDVLTPMVAKYLQTRVGAKNAIRNKDICHAFGVQGYQGLKEARMRKVVIHPDEGTRPSPCGELSRLLLRHFHPGGGVLLRQPVRARHGYPLYPSGPQVPTLRQIIHRLI